MPFQGSLQTECVGQSFQPIRTHDPRTNAPQRPHFRVPASTTVIRLNNPLSANPQEIDLCKLLTDKGL